MGDLDLLLFAMVAAFLVLRLRSVLGKRTEHERPQQDQNTTPEEQKEHDSKVVEIPYAGSEDAAPEAEAEAHDTALVQINEIRAMDPTFNLSEFSDGARGAFEMVVEGFAAGNTEMLEALLSDDVFDNFSTSIKDRKDAAQTLETTIIGIKSSEVIEAGMDGHNALVTVKFVSEQVNVTRDSEDRIIDGVPNQATEITDIWTFSRDAKSRDPNWLLVETRSPN
ncbi:MAG: Tim44/TimA family putative adaptor protein [Pseudomonadota bacterium]|nr:Tim44/TimA family putative adaptor protein [Pseudomonadota bacterium]